MRPVKLLHWCERCQRIEFCEQAGPFFVRCTECMGLTAKALG